VEAKTKKIKVVKPIIIEGKHVEADSVHTLPRHKAIELIGSGCAMPADDSDESDETKTVKIEHGDPTPKHGDPDPTKRQTAKK
jgi:hypothetical protein